METSLIIIQVIFVLLFILLIRTIIKYPKDILRGFFLIIEPEIFKPITWIFLPLWLIAYSLNKFFKWDIILTKRADRNLSEDPYESELNLSFNFQAGDKYIFFTGAPHLINAIIKSFPDYKPEDFKLLDKGVVKCPVEITFFDFSILVQHFWNESKIRSYGIFLSDGFSFYMYQDERTLHNLIGKTHDDKKFSVYTLNDLDEHVYLRVNKNLRVDEFDIQKSEVHLVSQAK